MPVTGMTTVRDSSVTPLLDVSLPGVPGSARVPLIVSSNARASLRDHSTAQHAHAAGELVRARRLRLDVDRGALVRRQKTLDAEGGKDELLAAARCLAT